MKPSQLLRNSIVIGAVCFACVLGYIAWGRLQPAALPEGFASANGRIEAVEIDIATKVAGRLDEVLVDEGDFVVAGQVLARMNTDVLDAQLHEAQSELKRAMNSVEAAQSVVQQREAEKAAAESLQLQREAELDLATKNLARAERLVKTKALAMEEFDTIRASFFSAQAALSTAKANVAGADAAIATAKSQVIQNEASVESAKARIDRIQADINDCTLKSPRDGRVQFRIAQPGEVLNVGGKVLNMVDLGDVYMTFFLPTAAAGRIQLGSEARLVLDAAPQYVIPARVTFVADVAQFTPKTVETTEERQKLMFRIKAHIDPELLKKYIRSVKTGLPGMAYVKISPQAEWPAHLEVKLPQ
jgi:HlyD family secretion protein